MLEVPPKPFTLKPNFLTTKHLEDTLQDEPTMAINGVLSSPIAMAL